MRYSRLPAWLNVSTFSIRLHVKMLTTMNSFLDDRGQDLVEYAIVASLISLAAIASMQSVATAISTAYIRMGIKFSTYTT
jgi:Flp pilus assembly pilin Flp